MFGSYDNLTAQTASIAAAYQTILEKKHEKKKPAEKDVETVAKELEKVADELKESFVLVLLEETEGTVRVSPERVAEIKRKADAFRDSLTPEDIAKFMAVMAQGKKAPDIHGDIHRDNDMGNTQHGVSESVEDIMQALGLTEDKKEALTSALEEAWGGGSDLQDDYVARQFAAGKPGKRKSAHTDGKIYWLHGNEIARQHAEPGKMEFNWAGWYTPTTERHLNTILKQVAPGKSVAKKQHKDQGIERFTLDHFKAPDPGADAQPNPHDGKDK